MENYKRLERDVNHQVIGGVCSGLGNYFGIDTAILRALFVIAFFFAGSGLGIYLILWIVMPAKRITDQTYQSQTQENTDNGNTPNENNGNITDEKRENKVGLIAGLCFIVVGICFLLVNFLPSINLTKYWPVLLIILGLFLIFPIKNTNHEK